MKRLEGRIAVVTGAGRGLGREHALLLAHLGASVVVNDLGGSLEGNGVDPTPAHQVASEIVASGGQAVASTHDVADWSQAHDMIELAVQTFGGLDVLVNNAGILRDRTLANMSEAEWDAVIRVHLRGHAAPTHHAFAYWRDSKKAGRDVKASVIHTTSVAAFAGNYGQANYVAAKMAILGLSRVTALEGEKYGVRSNAMSPSARTRLGLAGTGADELLRIPDAPNTFDRFHPANVSPLVAWLADARCSATAQVFQVDGNRVLVVRMSSVAGRISTGGRWTLEALDELLPGALVAPAEIGDFVDLDASRLL